MSGSRITFAVPVSPDAILVGLLLALSVGLAWMGLA